MKTIKTNTHLLLVNETAKIKEDDWVFDSTNYGLIHKVWEVTETHFSFKDSLHAKGLKSTNKNLKRHFIKIIASYPIIDNLPEFETLPPNILTFKEWSKNPDRIVDVNRMNCSIDEEYFNNYVNKTLPPNTEDDVDWNSLYLKNGINLQDDRNKLLFRKGYKQAKSETMFSLEDMISFAEWIRKEDITLGLHYFYKDGNELNGKELLNIYIQSISKQKEYEFVPEMEELGEVFNGQKSTKIYSDKQPKTVNNKIQGTWKLIK